MRRNKYFPPLLDGYSQEPVITLVPMIFSLLLFKIWLWPDTFFTKKREDRLIERGARRNFSFLTFESLSIWIQLSCLRAVELAKIILNVGCKTIVLNRLLRSALNPRPDQESIFHFPVSPYWSEKSEIDQIVGNFTTNSQNRNNCHWWSDETDMDPSIRFFGREFHWQTWRKNGSHHKHADSWKSEY